MAGYSHVMHRRWTVQEEIEVATKIIELEQEALDEIKTFSCARKILESRKNRREETTRFNATERLTEAVQVCLRTAKKTEDAEMLFAAKKAKSALEQANHFQWKLAGSASKLMKSEARRFSRLLRTDVEDMFQDAEVGALNAAKRFEPKHGIRFTTYARWWIRAEVTRRYELTGNNVRLPGGASENLRNLKREIQKNPDGYSLEEIAARVGISTVRAQFLLSEPNCSISIEDENERGHRIGDVLVDRSDDAQVFDKISAQLTLERISPHLDTKTGSLSGRCIYVLVRYYGLDGLPPDTYSKIGKAMGLSRERARQLHNDAMEILRFKVA